MSAQHLTRHAGGSQGILRQAFCSPVGAVSNPANILLPAIVQCTALQRRMGQVLRWIGLEDGLSIIDRHTRLCRLEPTGEELNASPPLTHLLTFTKRIKPCMRRLWHT